MTDTATTAVATDASGTVIPFPGAPLPRCRLCGHQGHWLGDHLAEEHRITLDDYLWAYPNSPTASQDAVAELDKVRQRKRRAHPPLDTELTVDIRGLSVCVNPDVAEDVCLPLPDHYAFPEHGDLGIDVLEALIAVLMRRHTYIYGMPGSGKDAFIHALSWLLRRPTLFRQLDPNVDVESWLYTREFDDVGTRFDEQELLICLRDGCTTATGRRIPWTVLITDFDRANPDQAEFIRVIVDSITGRVRGPAGRIYKVFPGTQIIVTANTSGGGDARGRMVSANPIDGSILDRFERTFEFHWMDWADEGPIVKAKHPLLVERCPDIFEQVGKATASLRKAINKNKLYGEFSHRALCAWLGHAQDIVSVTGRVEKNLARRSARAFLDKMPDADTRLAATKLIDPHIKGGLIGRGIDSAQRGSLGGFKA